MNRFWTCYWRYSNWYVNPEFMPLRLSGSNQFRARGVSKGDVAYVVSTHEGQLLLGGRMIVDRIASRAAAVSLAQRDLINVDEWIVGKYGSGTPLNHHRRLAPEVTKELRFIGAGSNSGQLRFVNSRDLDRQTIRGVRELTPESARCLDLIIEITDRFPPSDNLLTITRELLRELKIGADVSGFELFSAAAFREGRTEQVLVNRYERDPDARAECIRHYGAACFICGFDFVSHYGEVASGFVHVHHLIPLSCVGQDYHVDPVKHLRPVCPNCHAVIHRRTPPYSPIEMQQFIRQARHVSAVRE